LGDGVIEMLAGTSFDTTCVDLLLPQPAIRRQSRKIEARDTSRANLPMHGFHETLRQLV
jgi:hypothetical protein